MITALFYSGFNTLAKFLLRNKVFILGHHSVCAENTSDAYLHLYSDLSLPAKKFRSELLFLRKSGHTFVDFSELPTALNKGVKKPTVIYFDDGFKDNLTVAAPILKELGIPATFFITVGYVGKKNYSATIYYRYLLLLEDKGVDVEFEINKFKELSYKERLELIERKKIRVPHAQAWSDLPVFMDWNDVRTLSSLGFTIGSHGVTHTKLTECSPEELNNEIINSKEIIQKEISKPVLLFSYPHGRLNTKVVASIKKAGYRFAVTTESGVNDYREISDSSLILRTLSPRVYENSKALQVRIYARTLIKKYDFFKKKNRVI